jgi:endonuclease YncB( thermonuclease family)
LAKNKSNSKKYISGSLLLLAFCFYMVFGPGRHGHQPQRQHKEEKIREHKIRHNDEPLRDLTVFTGKVTGIKDGDTFEVLFDGQPEKVRLAEIDCPEKSQAFGKNAKQYASNLCFGKTVTVISTGKRDRYQRVVGTIVTADSVNVNQELVKAGFAWHYKQYSKSKELSQMEDKAREAHLGLWADEHPQAPWEWRREKRLKQQQVSNQ